MVIEGVQGHYVSEVVNPTALALVRRHVCIHCGEVIGPRWLAGHLERKHSEVLIERDSDE